MQNNPQFATGCDPVDSFNRCKKKRCESLLRVLTSHSRAWVSRVLQSSLRTLNLCADTIVSQASLCNQPPSDQQR